MNRSNGLLVIMIVTDVLTTCAVSLLQSESESVDDF